MPQAKHDSYLDCLTDISTQLLSAPDPWSVLPKIIDWLKSITGVNRCYMAELIQHEADEWHGAVRFDSRAGDGPPVIPDAERLVWDTSAGHPPWLLRLTDGTELSSVEGMSVEVPEFVDANADGWLVLPLIINHSLSGCLGVDLADPGPLLGGQDVSLLRAAANLISAALERMAAERSLRGAHALLSTILRSTGDLVMIATDLKLRIRHYSPGAEDLLGYSEQHVIGRHLDRLEILDLPGGDLTEEFLTTLIGEGPIDLESEIRDPRGEYQTVTVHVSGMIDSKGAPVGYLILIRNVTEERRLQKRTLQSQRMESVGMLAGGVAHDFNNILMGILGYTSLMKDLLNDDHPAYRMLTTIEQSGERAAALTSELLAYARGGKYRSVAIRVDEQTDELLNILGTNLPRGVVLMRDYAADLPFIVADPVQLQQVIMNICINAGDAIKEYAEALDDESYVGEINFSTKVLGLDLARLNELEMADEVEAGRFVVLSIRDNGCGMDAETKLKIFEPFFTTKFTGRGLGLAAVDGIIRNHGGFMTVESEPGQGACFTIYLPVATVFEEHVPVEEKMILTGAETILFVDDEDIIRQLALLNLTNLGYQVLLAANGREAIEVYREHHAEIDLIVLDMVMPGISGEAAIRELHAVNPDATILLTSGYDEPTVMKMGDYSRITAFLQKPYTPEALSRAVRKTLDN